MAAMLCHACHPNRRAGSFQVRTSAIGADFGEAAGRHIGDVSYHKKPGVSRIFLAIPGRSVLSFQNPNNSLEGNYLISQ